MFSIKLLNNEVAFGQGATVQFQFYVEGVATAPTSGKFTLKNPGGETIIDQQNMTINGTLIKYVMTAGNLSEMLENYRILIEYVYNSITYTANFLLDVVLTPLVLSVSNSDLLERHPDLNYDLWEGITSYSTQIEKAFEIVKKDIKNKGRRPSLIIDASQIDILIEFKALELIFFDFSTDNEGINWDKYLKYAEKYNQELSSMNLKYDFDEDGTIDGNIAFGTIDLVR
ncbi:MAG: hypothetical protein GY870_15020 [archaeon]|nr:hypothetical protein [archaeon]